MLLKGTLIYLDTIEYIYFIYKNRILTDKIYMDYLYNCSYIKYKGVKK